MSHTSIKLDSPCEFINITPLNPLISKCQIKVCYVSDEPNRNRSVITKEVATQMANSLPGSPIVGFYNEATGDFEEHNRVIDVSNGKFEIKDTTRPYGFVDLSAKCWFQKFLDDGLVEREYLMTEGYLWTGQYPESKRILEAGNNQSMELDKDTLDATWTKNKNGVPQFFIINEAVISKLCILGEDCEPCFEGATITDIQFSFEDSFKKELHFMIQELNELLKGGETQVFTRYAVEIGDRLWSSLYSYLEKAYPQGEDCYCSAYSIEGIYEEQGQKFTILQNRADGKLYRLNFSLTEESGLQPAETFIEVTKTYTPVNQQPQFDAEKVAAYELEYAEKKKKEKEEEKAKEADKTEKTEDPKSEDKKEGESKEEPKEEKTEGESKEEKPAEKEDKSDDNKEEKEEKTEDEEDEKKKKKSKFSLDEIPEYVELSNKYSELETSYAALEEEVAALREFKAQAEKAEKEQMIDSFYMLSDEDKSEIRENIDKYSLRDIEAELSIMCVRNKVSFNLEEETHSTQTEDPTVYNLNNGEFNDEAMPAWIKAAINVEKRMNE